MSDQTIYCSQPGAPLDDVENHVHAAAWHLEVASRALAAQGRPIGAALDPIHLLLCQLLNEMHRESQVIQYAGLSDEQKAAALLATFARGRGDAS